MKDGGVKGSGQLGQTDDGDVDGDDDEGLIGGGSVREESEDDEEGFSDEAPEAIFRRFSIFL